MPKLKRAPTVIFPLFLGLALGACQNPPQIGASETTDEGPAADQPRLTRFSDIPIPAGAQMNVTRSLILGPADAWVGRLVFNASTGSQTLYQFYTREMPRFKWQEVTRVRAQVSILTYTRGARTATVQISSTTLGGSVVSVTMAPATRPAAPQSGTMAPTAPAAPRPETAPLSPAPQPQR
ncbi:MAG: hypothetical protein OEO83_15085 [Alphaproteobacteria bacterium]|nr:hypothetical protein [Alphaproteobacteria bacterium]